MASRIFIKTRKLGSATAHVQYKPPPVSALFPHMFKVNTTNNELIPGVGTPISLEGFEPNFGKDHVFEKWRLRDIERHPETEEMCFKTEISYQSGYLDKLSKNRGSDCYQPASNVSLHSVMQSNVPEPYFNTGKPAHLNMPGGSYRFDEKYTSNKLTNNHPSRSGNAFNPIGSQKDNTSTISLTGMQSLFPRRSFSTSATSSLASVQPIVDESEIIPDSIHPDEKHIFVVWMQNNKKYFLNYTEQYNKLAKGEVSIRDLIEKQNAILGEIAHQYEIRHISEKGYSFEGVQGPIGPQPWLDNHTVASLTIKENPCPQGVQGLNCEHFKVWLDNCTKYQFIHCDDQLKEVQEGRKTLGMIFEEQERLIKEVAEDYRAKANGQVGNDHTVPMKLSQKEKLKRAVKEYGSTVIVFHIAISLASLGGFYLAVSSGIDMVGLLGKLGVGQSILESRLAAGTGTFVVAYAVHKVFAPVRIGITLTSTPFIVRYLRRIGFLKVPAVKK